MFQSVINITSSYLHQIYTNGIKTSLKSYNHFVFVVKTGPGLNTEELLGGLSGRCLGLTSVKLGLTDAQIQTFLLWIRTSGRVSLISEHGPQTSLNVCPDLYFCLQKLVYSERKTETLGRSVSVCGRSALCRQQWARSVFKSLYKKSVTVYGG